MIDVTAVRSLLFLPASNPRAIEKARTLPADLIVLDLEDSVKPQDKAAARDAALLAAAQGFGKPCAIRVNAAGTPWHLDDLAAATASAAAVIVLPKVETAPAPSAKPVLAMIETPTGVIAAPHIASASSVAGLMLGVNDLAAALRLPPDGGRAGLALILQSVLLAARLGGVAAFDGVFNQLDDPEGLAAECREGRSFGYDGKSLIHPNQIETANRIFGPSEVEIEDARALIAAAQGGAERFRDRMIEAMHVDAAKRLLARIIP